MTGKLLRGLALALSTAGLLGTAETSRAATTLHQVRGLAFRPDGKGLMVPVRVGIAVYRDGHWNKVPGADYEFKGFSMASNTIYASGHPAPGDPLTNPLGLVKSTDGGATWRWAALSGESDFHLMAAGYRSNVLYVVNTEPNSRMPERGVYFTQDGGKPWKPSPSAGLSSRMASLAVHPSRPGTVAVGTSEGAYVSQDFGASFSRIGPQAAVTAVFFDHDAEHLYSACWSTGTAPHRARRQKPYRAFLAEARAGLRDLHRAEPGEAKRACNRDTAAAPVSYAERRQDLEADRSRRRRALSGRTEDPNGYGHAARRRRRAADERRMAIAQRTRDERTTDIE